MSDTELVPCPEWVEKLADLHAHTLSSSDQAALEAHLRVCRACSLVLLEYQRMDEQIHQALNVKSFPSFTPNLLRARRTISDKWLVQQAQRGGQDLLFNRYYGSILRYLMGSMENQGDALDAPQEAILKEAEKLASAQDGKYLEQWLNELARSIAIDHMRRMAERYTFLSPEEALIDAANRSEPLLSIARELPLRIRRCLTLYIEGHKYHEIAQTLNLKESTVKMYLHEARKRVREALGYSDG